MALDLIKDVIQGRQAFDYTLGETPNQELEIFRLGNVTFHGFEAPNLLHVLEKQATSVRDYIGGGRSVQSLGHQWGDIKWNGKLVPQREYRTAQTGDLHPASIDPIARMYEISAMNVEGLPVDFIYGKLHWSVIISSFDYDIKNRSEVDYSISLIVIEAKHAPVDDSVSAQDSLSLSLEIKTLVDRTGGLLGILEESEISIIIGAQMAAAIKSGNVGLAATSALVAAQQASNIFGAELPIISTANELVRTAKLFETIARSVID